MDPIALVVIGVVVAGVAWWMLSGKDDTPEAPAPTPTPNPTPGKLRSKPAPKTPAKPKADSLPSDSALNGLTKAKLEELGRDHGVELDKRKTKANMIADLKGGAKRTGRK